MNLYWDYENKGLMDSLNSGHNISSLQMTLRDQEDITLYVMCYDPTTRLNVLVDCPAGQSPLFGLKGKTQAKLAGDYLVVQSVWTKTATGTYTGLLDLATDELKAEFGTAAVSVALKGEFTLRDADERDHFSTQIDVTANYDVNGIGEGATHSVYLGTSTLVHQEVIDGINRVIISDSTGKELLCLPPREV